MKTSESAPVKKEAKTIQELLAKIQQALKAPKNQRNTYGNYNYRSCEDILEAVKPLLEGAVLIIGDEIVNIGNRNYVKATAMIAKEEGKIECSAFAREAEERKGMDVAQVTGATSSYARKYALNGLFAIDDTKDPDTMDNSKTQNVSVPNSESTLPVNTTKGYSSEPTPEETEKLISYFMSIEKVIKPEQLAEVEETIKTANLSGRERYVLNAKLDAKKKTLPLPNDLPF